MGKEIVSRESKVMDAMQVESVKNQLSNLLQNNPKKIEAFKTKMLKIALSYGLDKCTPESVINCGLQAVSLNLPLEAGQGYVVNYGGAAQFDAGYKGWKVLAKRAGYSTIADTVYSCDEFHEIGFGFDTSISLKKNNKERETSNDEWAIKNLTQVIVSIKEDSTGLITTEVVPADMIHKIVGMSPSMGSEKARQYSPHANWADQMFKAKAVKQVLSKFPIDISSASQLHEAIEIVNSTEIKAQENAPPAGLPSYSQDRLDDNFPKWKKSVQEGRHKAMAIISTVSNGFSLEPEQFEQLYTLRDFEPTDAELTDVEGVETDITNEEDSAPEQNENPPVKKEISPEAAEFFKGKNETPKAKTNAK